MSTTDFDITDEKKRALLEQGVAGAERFFRWFEDPEKAPTNRVPTRVVVSLGTPAPVVQPV